MQNVEQCWFCTGNNEQDVGYAPLKHLVLYYLFVFRQGYLDKLIADPHNLTAQRWITDSNAPPPLTNLDIVNYLVFGQSANNW